MATLGKPEIPTPGAMTLAVLQLAVNNIRERFKVLEAAVSLNLKTATASQTGTATDLGRQIVLLRADLDALTTTLAGLNTGEDAPDHSAAIAALRRQVAAAEGNSPAPPTRATIRAAVAEAEQFAPESPWRWSFNRLAERVEALELGSAP